VDTRVLLDHEPVADGGYLVRALLRIDGQAPEAISRPRLNLAIVLDCSGSMEGEKLERAKEAASLLVRRLADQDVVSVVAYDDQVYAVADRIHGSQRHEVLMRVASIRTGGTTNLSGGWLRGRDRVAAGLVDGGVNRVLLMTDGLANVGITDPHRLGALVGSAAAMGVSTTTIGFGADFDERLLQTLADAGGGSTYYIETPDQAPDVFETEIQGLMALAAQNVAVTVAPGTRVEHAKVLHQYPSRPAGGGSIRLELGDLYALEPRSVLMEFLVREDEEAEVDVATVMVEGYVLLPNGNVEKRSVTLPIQVTRMGVAVVEPEVRKELLLLEAARVREEALEDRARGEFRYGAERLRRTAEKLESQAAHDPAVRDEMEDLRELAQRYEEEQVSAADAKWMYHRAHSRSRSREAAMEAVRAARAMGRRKRGDE
jgi:Ca-activated chloride channel homolog